MEKAKEIKPKNERRIPRKPVADGGKSLMSANSNFHKVISPTGHGYLSEDGGIEGEPSSSFPLRQLPCFGIFSDLL